MNATTELQKYFYKDIAEVITEYTEDVWSFYTVNKYLSWSSANTLNTFINPIICRGIKLRDSLYYVCLRVQEVREEFIRNLPTLFSPRALGVCRDKFFLVTYGRLLVVHDVDWRILYEYDIGNLFMSTLCCYGSCVYLAGREFSSEYKSSGQLIKLSCSETGELSGVKAIKVATCAMLLTSNINYLCVRVGNKVVVYHADSLYKVASVNIGKCIYDGIIKGGSLVLRTREGEVRVRLRDFRKSVVNGRIETCELPERLVVKV